MYTRLEAGGPVQFPGFNGELICPAYHELCNVACVPGNGQCPGSCNFDGDCIEGRCHCFLGFHGHDCSKRSCPNNCSGHGTCHSNGLCECESVRAGIDCSTGNCDGLVDPKLENNYNMTEMFNMIEAAAACVRYSAPKRPRIQVVRALDSQDDMPDLTNGIKYGQSQVFNQGQTSADMQKFHQMAFGNDTDTLEYDSGASMTVRPQPTVANSEAENTNCRHKHLLFMSLTLALCFRVKEALMVVETTNMVKEDFFELMSIAVVLCF